MKKHFEAPLIVDSLVDGASLIPVFVREAANNVGFEMKGRG